MNQLNEVKILLVEDNPDDAELTMRSLKSSNFINEIVWLKDGEEALHYLRKKGRFSSPEIKIKPTLILLDLKLPKVNGTEVLEQIKLDSELKKIPVVVMTSSKENSDIDRCYELGVNSYVVKPIDFEQFTRVTKEISMYWVLINEIPS